MVYQIEILSSALEDAKKCYEFLAASSPEKAGKWIDSLIVLIYHIRHTSQEFMSAEEFSN